MHAEIRKVVFSLCARNHLLGFVATIGRGGPKNVCVDSMVLSTFLVMACSC